MAPRKKEFVQCAHCGRFQVESNEQNGFVVSLIGQMKLFWRIECKCGVMTKLCDTREALQVVWNSRASKPYVPSKIEVISHPSPRGLKATMLDK